MDKYESHAPIIKGLETGRKKYHSKSLAGLAVITTIAIVVAQVIPEVGDYLTEKQIIPYITLIVVIDFALAWGKKSDFRISSNQDESIPEITAYIPGSKQADMLEYAGATTLPLIRAIQREGVILRLLIKHPDTVDGLQRQRTLAMLDTVINSVFDGVSTGFEVRCYKLPYAVRGRHIHGRILELGWLTPDTKRQTVYGHSNPSILIKPSGASKDFFVRTFDSYWADSDTEDGREVLAKHVGSRKPTSPIS